MGPMGVVGEGAGGKKNQTRFLGTSNIQVSVVERLRRRALCVLVLWRGQKKSSVRVQLIRAAWQAPAANLGADDLLFSRHGVLQCAEAGRFPPRPLAPLSISQN